MKYKPKLTKMETMKEFKVQDNVTGNTIELFSNLPDAKQYWEEMERDHKDSGNISLTPYRYRIIDNQGHVYTDNVYGFRG